MSESPTNHPRIATALRLCLIGFASFAAVQAQARDPSEASSHHQEALDLNDTSQPIVATALPPAQFAKQLADLRAFGKNRIGTVGGGPMVPGKDVELARAIVLAASTAQLQSMIEDVNAAVRAHTAREIIRHRPDALALVHKLRKDQTRIAVGNMNDVGPFHDLRITIAEMIRHELAYNGVVLPAP